MIWISLVVDAVFGQARKSFIGLRFFFQSLLEKVGCIGVVELQGVRTRRTVSRDFKVLDFLLRCNQNGITNGWLLRRLQEFLSFCDDSFNASVRNGFGSLSHLSKD